MPHLVDLPPAPTLPTYSLFMLSLSFPLSIRERERKSPYKQCMNHKCIRESRARGALRHIIGTAAPIVPVSPLSEAAIWCPYQENKHASLEKKNPM